jgi:hypothetical protein
VIQSINLDGHLREYDRDSSATYRVFPERDGFTVERMAHGKLPAVTIYHVKSQLLAITFADWFVLHDKEVTNALTDSTKLVDLYDRAINECLN